jgi:hypothetical protein
MPHYSASDSIYINHFFSKIITPGVRRKAKAFAFKQSSPSGPFFTGCQEKSLGSGKKEPYGGLKLA